MKGTGLVNGNVGPLLKVGLCLLVLLAQGPAAMAFFPIAGTSAFTLDIEFISWPLDAMDTNDDGDVNGPDEGVKVTFEGGEFGFTDEEMATVEEAFDVWEDVSTSYVGFHFTLPITDPVTILQADGINFVAMETPDDPFPVGGVGGGVIGLTLFTLIIEDTFLTMPDGTIFPVTGGQILEADIVFDAAVHRSPAPGVPPEVDLLSTAVHEIGHFIGIDHTILSNFEFDAETGVGIESAVFGQRDATGRLRQVGLTPTMFPFVYSVDDGTGELSDGMADLAPDDIAAVSFLYPRSNQDDFFTIAHWARSQGNTTIPSRPLLGGMVTAWCDVDDNPATPRVPFMNTMTGLFEPNTEEQRRGRFELKGLLKAIEAVGISGPFQATYALTIDPVSNFRFPIEPAESAQTYDSTHNQRAGDAWAVAYDTVFPSETFNVDGELFGSENHDAGTILAWDDVLGEVVEPSSGKNLRALLPTDTPMFGDRNEVCPLNLVVPAFVMGKGPMVLRDFRDGVLLQTAAGAALVDAYYQMGPAAVGFLLEHPIAYRALWLGAGASEWCLVNGDIVIALALIAGVLVLGYGGRRKGAAAAGLIALAGFGLLAGPAQGAILPLSDSELTSMADFIVTGEVIGVESTFVAERRRVVTTVTIETEGVLKGRLNKGSLLHIDFPFGRVGEYITYAPALPRFAVGEEVLLFLQEHETAGLTVVGGILGKRLIFSKEGEAERFVTGNPAKPDPAVGDRKPAKDGEPVTERPVGKARLLVEYEAAIREVVRKQKEHGL